MQDLELKTVNIEVSEKELNVITNALGKIQSVAADKVILKLMRIRLDKHYNDFLRYDHGEY